MRIVHDVRMFMGIVNCYRKFVMGYSKIATSLSDLLKKDREWNWMEKCQASFCKLKHKLTMTPILRLSNFENPFEVQTNTFDFTIGGVLK